MRSARRIKVIIALFVILAGVNVLFSFLAMRANHAAAHAFEERHALISAVYETNIAAGAFTRMARYYAIAGDESTYQQFRAEMELDRYGRKRDAFAAFNAPANEIELMETLIEQRLLMFAIHYEVVQLRSAGYVEEASAMAHGPAVARIGGPLGGMADELSALVYERTMGRACAYSRAAEIFEALILIIVVLIALGGALWIVLAGKAGMTRRIEVFGAAFLIIAFASLFFSLSANSSARNRLDAFQHQYALSIASYNAERGAEILTRLSRMYVVTGGAMQFNQYFAELERDRFGHALETFILMSAESREINMMVDILGRLTRLRQIESQSMLLRTAGYWQEALEMAFGPAVAALDGPLGTLGEELREAVNTRARETITAAARNYDMFVLATIITALFLAAAGFGALFVVKNTPQKAAPGIAALVIRQISNAAIRTKLFASFAIVIILFTAQVGISAYLDAQIHRLSNHNLYYMMERSGILWAYHQEFTEMRRLLRETFLSVRWLAEANEADWIGAERRLSASYDRLTELAEAYETSVKTDPIFPIVYEDSRIVILAEVMSHVTTIYEVYRENFFLSGTMNLDPGNVMDYTGAAEIMLGMLRQFINVNHAIAEDKITYYRSFSNTVTAVSLFAAIVLALLLAYFVLRSFTRRITTVEAAANKIAQGDFDASLQGSTDEIAAIFSKMTGVFTSLINEINFVTDEGKKGNTDARIDTSRFLGGYKDTALAINTLLDVAAELLEQKEQLQIAQDASEAKSRFLAKMSHEIRTPITAVLGISEMQLRNSSLPLEAEEAFAKIYSSGNALLGIVNDILDLSKIEAGKIELYNEKYEVVSLLSDVAQLQLAYMGSKQLAFNIDVAEDIPTHLIGDELRIKQVLNNLLSNAFKYTIEGSVSLKVYLKDKNQSDYLDVVIVVQDTGRGMNDEQLDGLFDEYSRFHEKEARFEPGTGLGMSITSNLLQMMGATIDVGSEVGKGTTVTVVLPQKTGSSETLGAEKASNLKNFNTDTHSAAKRLSFTPEPMPYGRVLIVDDMEANIYVVKGLIKMYQLQIDTCCSGPAAITRIKNGEVYDIIFMDQMMPEMDGLEAAAIIRKMNYNHPIVALTANALVGQAEMFLQNGFDGFLSKPIQTVHLNTVLHKFIKDRHPEAAAVTAAEISTDNADKTENKNIEGIDDYFDTYLKSSGIYDRVRIDFARRQKNTMQKIMSAIESNDLKTAHRLVHTLKGLAGLISEKDLLNLSIQAETAFIEEAIPADLMDTLGLEMERVLARIEDQYKNQQVTPHADMILDKDKARKLFDKVYGFLETDSFGALLLCSDLAEIPGTSDLINQIETMDFTLALKTLTDLRETLEL